MGWALLLGPGSLGPGLLGRQGHGRPDPHSVQPSWSVQTGLGWAAECWWRGGCVLQGSASPASRPQTDWPLLSQGLAQAHMVPGCCPTGPWVRPRPPSAATGGSRVKSQARGPRAAFKHLSAGRRPVSTVGSSFTPRSHTQRECMAPATELRPALAQPEHGRRAAGCRVCLGAEHLVRGL